MRHPPALLPVLNGPWRAAEPLGKLIYRFVKVSAERPDLLLPPLERRCPSIACSFHLAPPIVKVRQVVLPVLARITNAGTITGSAQRLQVQHAI